MKALLKVLSVAGLTLTIVPSFFVFSGAITWERHATLMVVGMILWFASAPFWMKREGPQ
ncbi:MAG: hypothetical protein P8Z74_07190 [Acidobacteriota bacterium]|jgi:hypothetical protein